MLMRKYLLGVLAILLLGLAQPTRDFFRDKWSTQQKTNSPMGQVESAKLYSEYPQVPKLPVNSIEAMIHKEAPTLTNTVIKKVMATIDCAKEYSVEYNPILTIIDYSLPSSEKRLWIFNLTEQKLLFHTYVSHGIKSGTLLSQYFSNKFDSKASSIGVYKTEKAYYGREGLSLRLDGLDKPFNNNAFNRYIVMHAGWYVEESFIKKYGRPGRSWGCPAVPHELSGPIINTIKENSLFVVYYPSDEWFANSKFLNCKTLSAMQDRNALQAETKPVIDENEQREEILFVDLNRNNKREENEPILVISADNYIQLFNTPAPLGRMLRRQINKEEYIALSSREFNTITQMNSGALNPHLTKLLFIIPVVEMHRGYYETRMEVVKMGPIKEVRQNAGSSKSNESSNNYTVYFNSRPYISLKATNRFIRWLGL